jgi:hypothetical protein
MFIIGGRPVTARKSVTAKVGPRRSGALVSSPSIKPSFGRPVTVVAHVTLQLVE